MSSFHSLLLLPLPYSRRLNRRQSSSSVYSLIVVVVAVLLSACQMPVREPAPGANLPALHVYEMAEALDDLPVDNRSHVTAEVRFSDTLDQGLRLRIRSVLSSLIHDQNSAVRSNPNSDQVLQSWPIVFADENSADSATHRLSFTAVGDAVVLTVWSADDGELSKTTLTLASDQNSTDDSIDLNRRGKPIATASLYKNISSDARQSLSSILSQLGKGAIHVSSSSSAQIFLKEENRLLSIGTTPGNISIRSGIRSVLLRRHGQPDQIKKLRVRDGQTRVVIASWSDDADPGSTYIVSSPKGLRVAFDGQIIGETPLAHQGIIAGSYEVELSEKTATDDFNVINTDQLIVKGGRRTDRLYPLDYYLRFEGQPLRSSLEDGVWQYVSPDQRFGILDFDHPETVGQSGIVTMPISNQPLQFELILPDESGSVGVYGVADRFLIEPLAESLVFRIESSAAKEIYSLSRKPKGQVYVIGDIDPKSGNLHVRVNGTVMYDGPFAAGDSLRIVCLGSQSGQKLPEEIALRSGGEQGGFFFKTGRYLWYNFKTLFDSKLQLKSADVTKKTSPAEGDAE